MVGRYGHNIDLAPEPERRSQEWRLGTSPGSWEHNPRTLIEPNAVVLRVVDCQERRRPSVVAAKRASRVARDRSDVARQEGRERLLEIGALLPTSTEIDDVVHNIARSMCTVAGYSRCLIASARVPGGNAWAGELGMGSNWRTCDASKSCSPMFRCLRRCCRAHPRWCCNQNNDELQTLVDFTDLVVRATTRRAPWPARTMTDRPAGPREDRERACPHGANTGELGHGLTGARPWTTRATRSRRPTPWPPGSPGYETCSTQSGLRQPLPRECPRPLRFQGDSLSGLRCGSRRGDRHRAARLSAAYDLAAPTNASKSRGSSPCSGCHCTATRNRAEASSIASSVPSGAQADGT